MVRIYQSFTCGIGHYDLKISLRAFISGGRFLTAGVRKDSDDVLWSQALIFYDKKDDLTMEDIRVVADLLERAAYWSVCLDAFFPTDKPVENSWGRAKEFGEIVKRYD